MSEQINSTKTPISTGKVLGQIWGILFLTALFGFGGYRLLSKGIQIYQQHPPLSMLDYLLYLGIGLFGLGKAEMLFRRVFVPRTLARAKEALGETGWTGDYWLAPFCMMSLYRPWQRKHQIMTLLLVPLMVGLAVFFAIGNIAPSLKGPVDLAIGFALAYAAVWYLISFVRVVGWWLASGLAETSPLPAWNGVKAVMNTATA